MKVKELIEKLKEFDPELDIATEDASYDPTYCLDVSVDVITYPKGTYRKEAVTFVAIYSTGCKPV